jgi:ligand-binding SRPBCC domain-containing protein
MRYTKQSHIAAPPAAVFAFHEQPDALARLTPPWDRVEIIEGGGSIRPGARVVLRLRVGPFWRRWVAEHVDYDPPHVFSDRQVSGPFQCWFHRHKFLDDGQGGTWLRDEVDFEPPLGPLGRLLAPLIRRRLERTFAFRHEQTRRIVEGRGGSP